MLIIMIISLLLLWALPLAALAQDVEDDETASSLAITAQQLQEDLQYLMIAQQDIVMHIVLPRNWETVEQGLDEDGNIRDDVDRFLLMARQSVIDPEDATTFIVELAIFKQRLLDGVTPAPTEALKDEQRAQQLWLFLNEMISGYLGQGLDVVTQTRDIAAKEYGIGDYRPKTMFVPIHFRHTENKTELFTFTGFEGDTIYTLSFLVSATQVENRRGLIGFIVNNTFSLTQEAWEDVLQSMEDQLE